VLSGLKISNLLVLGFCILYMKTACGVVQNRRLNDQIVNPVKFFVDRDSESAKVLYNLQEYNTVSIVGLTNIGKTEIARKYAVLNKNRYDLIWFFDSSLDLNEQFVALLQRLTKPYY